MSWDIMLFSTTQQDASDVEDIDETLFVPIDFDAVFRGHFMTIEADGEHREIKGAGYAIDYFAEEEPEATILVTLDGEAALYELIHLAKQQGWLIFDTESGEMIDPEHPENNGFEDYQKYVEQMLKSK